MKFIQTIRGKKRFIQTSREPKSPTSLKLARSRFQGICSGPTIGPGIARPNVLSSGFRRNLLQLGTTGIQTSLLSATSHSNGDDLDLPVVCHIFPKIAIIVS